MKLFTITSLITSLFISTAVAEEDHSHHEHMHHDPMDHSEHDHEHAPISVMGGHIHEKGEWMLSYRYMNMDMEGMQKGSDNLSSSEVFANGFMVSPTEMSMEMHMFGLMYAPTNWVTLMAMGNYIEKEMDHVTMSGSMAAMRFGSAFTRQSEGWGDTSISALWKLINVGDHSVHLTTGISLPTSSIDEEDNGLLPYPMQLGSGTYDLKPSITYNGHNNQFGWGAQLNGVFRLDDNDAGYALGDKWEIKAWGTYDLNGWIQFSSILSYEDLSSIEGSDSRIAARMNPTQDPANSGGETLNLGLGINIEFQNDLLKGNRLAIEYATPLDQDFNGIQMETNHTITVGLQREF